MIINDKRQATNFIVDKLVSLYEDGNLSYNDYTGSISIDLPEGRIDLNVTFVKEIN